MAEPRRPGRASFLAAAAAAGLASVAALWPAHGVLLNWDEVSYVDAAALGVGANRADSGSLTPRAFFRFAAAKWSGRPAALPDGYDEARDPLLLRNLHPPFVVLTLVPVAGRRSERVLRAGLMAGALLWSLGLVAAYAAASRAPTFAGLGATAVIAAWSSRLLFAALQCHGWMSLWTLAAGGLLAAWIARPRPAIGVLLCASLALGLATLHTGLVVGAAAALAAALWGRSSGAAHPRRLLLGALLALGFTLLAWPGLLLRVSLAKMFAYYVYIARLGQEYGEHWQRLPGVAVALLPLLVAGPAAVVALARRSRPAAEWAPAALLAAAYAAVVVPFAIVPQYLLPALAPLAPLVGVALDGGGPRARTVAALAVAALAAGSWAATPIAAPDADRRQDLAWMATALRGRRVVADGAHVYRHYLGPGYDVAPLTVSWDGSELLLRERGAYRVAGPGDVRGALVLVRRQRKRSVAEDVSAAAVAACRRIDRPTLIAFDCAAAP